MFQKKVRHLINEKKKRILLFQRVDFSNDSKILKSPKGNKEQFLNIK